VDRTVRLFRSTMKPTCRTDSPCRPCRAPSSLAARSSCPRSRGSSRGAAKSRPFANAGVLDLLSHRGTATACPSEVARALEPEDWRLLMDPVRAAAARLQRRGKVDVYQRGKVLPWALIDAGFGRCLRLSIPESGGRIVRRYATVEAKKRLHQDMFRGAARRGHPRATQAACVVGALTRRRRRGCRVESRLSGLPTTASAEQRARSRACDISTRTRKSDRLAGT